MHFFLALQTSFLQGKDSLLLIFSSCCFCFGGFFWRRGAGFLWHEGSYFPGQGLNLWPLQTTGPLGKSFILTLFNTSMYRPLRNQWMQKWSSRLPSTVLCASLGNGSTCMLLLRQEPMRCLWPYFLPHPFSNCSLSPIYSTFSVVLFLLRVGG